MHHGLAVAWCDSAVRIDESLHRPLDKTQAENHSLRLSIPRVSE